MSTDGLTEIETIASEIKKMTDKIDTDITAYKTRISTLEEENKALAVIILDIRRTIANWIARGVK